MMLPNNRDKLTKVKKPIPRQNVEKKKYSLKLLKQQENKKQNKAREIHENDKDELLTYAADQRITVKRGGIFPHAIQTDFLRKKDFQIPKLGVGKIPANIAGISVDLFSKKNKKTNKDGDRKNEKFVNNKYSPVFGNQENTPVQKKSFKNSFDLSEKNNQVFTPDNATDVDNDISSVISNSETLNINVKQLILEHHISRIQWYNKDEAYLHLLYREQAEVINKIMIFDQVTYFDNNTDAMQDIQQKLWKLRCSRDENLLHSLPTSAHSISEPLVIQHVGVNERKDSPMIIDGESTSNSSNYITPVFKQVPECSSSCVTPVDANENLFLHHKDRKVQFKFCSPSACKISQDNKSKRKNDVVFRTRKTLENIEKEKNTSCFKIPMSELDGLPANYQTNVQWIKPIVPDTIDQNLGLGPLQYLEYVTTKRQDKNIYLPETVYKPTIKRQPAEFSEYCHDLRNDTQFSSMKHQKYSKLSETRGYGNFELNSFPSEFPVSENTMQYCNTFKQKKLFDLNQETLDHRFVLHPS